MGTLSRIRDKTAVLKEDAYAMYIAAKDPRTPLFAKMVMALAAGYVLSPFDFIPDFLPFIGWVDDFLVLSLGLKLALWLTPPGVWEDAKTKAEPITKKIRTAYKVISTLLFLFWIVLFVLAVLAMYYLASLFRIK